MSDIVMCLQCGEPLGNEPTTFIDNSRPGLGGCHLRCVDAYHAQRRDQEERAATLPDPKKRMLHLIDRYGAARVGEELAGVRDATAAIKRNYDEGKKILADIGMDLDALLTELVGLRGRCLCKGAFRCTPCLEAMEAEGIRDAETDLVAVTEERDQLSSALEQAARDGNEFDRLRTTIAAVKESGPWESPGITGVGREIYVAAWNDVFDRLIARLLTEGMMLS